MASFVGDYTCKADNKCRVVVPSSFRKVMTASQQSFFVLRKNVFEKCIDMYPKEEWEKMMAELNMRLSRFKARDVAFFREFCRGTQEVEMDATGRILLPRKMLDEVGIRKEMILAAQGALIQVWDAEAYESTAFDPEKLGEAAEEILGREPYLSF